MSGLRMSLRPSPTRVKPVTSSTMRRPGHRARPPDAGAGVVDRALQVIAPLGRVGGLDPVAEEAEGGEGEDRVGRVQRRDRGHALDHVVEDVAADDRAPRCSERARGLHVGLLAHADHVVSDHPEVLRDVDDRDRDRRGEDALADRAREQERDHDRQQQVREGEQRVHDDHEHAVDLAADVARRTGRAGRRRASERMTARTTTSIAVREPQMIRERTSVDCTVVPNRCVESGCACLGKRPAASWHLIEAVRREHRGEDRHEHEAEDDEHADDQQPPRQAAGLAQRLHPAWGAHDPQYLTLGSTKALIRSIISETMTTATREDRDDPLDGDVVALVEVADQLRSDPRPVEGLLGEHRAAEQDRELQAGDGDHRARARCGRRGGRRSAARARRGRAPPRRSRRASSAAG